MDTETAGRRLAAIIDGPHVTVGDPRTSRRVTIAGTDVDLLSEAGAALRALGVTVNDLRPVRRKQMIDVTGQANFERLFESVAEHMQDGKKRAALQALANLNRVGRPRRATTQMIDDAAVMRERGMSLRSIGANLGLSKSTVARMLSRAHR